MYQLVVADDENIECMTLEYIVEHFLSDEVEVLESVQDGITLLKVVEEKKPDIAIVDINMPGLNGLDAIEILRLKHSEIKIIIHTAYSEFSYAQKALQLGAVDYLVKPNLKEEIIASIRKACSILKQERMLLESGEQTAIYEKRLKMLWGEKWMMSLFLGQPDEDSFTQLIKDRPDMLEGGIFTLWKTQNPLEHSFEETALALKENIGKYCTNICFQKNFTLYCLLFPGERSVKAEFEKWLEKLVHLVTRTEKWKDKLIIGASSWLERDFSKGIQECETAVFHRSQPGLYFVKNQKKQMVWEKRDIWKELARLFLEGKDDEAKALLEENLKRADEAQRAMDYSAERRFYFCKIFGAYLLLRMEEELEMLRGEELERNFLFWKTYEQIDNQCGLIHWAQNQYQELRKRCSHSYIERKNPYLQRAYQFVCSHYEKDIPLERCAEEAGISPFYLSRLLKSEMDVTFVEMLTDIRMRKVFLLLYETKKSIQEIGQMTGYQNQSYLYKVFKKTTGLPLGDVRQFS